MIDEDPGAFEDRDYLDQLNEETLGKYAYTIVRKGEQIIYEGNPRTAGRSLRMSSPPTGTARRALRGASTWTGTASTCSSRSISAFPTGRRGACFWCPMWMS